MKTSRLFIRPTESESLDARPRDLHVTNATGDSQCRERARLSGVTGIIAGKLTKKKKKKEYSSQFLMDVERCNPE